MSSGSKKVTVGYKYYFSAHIVLSYGPNAHIEQIRVDDRIVWEPEGDVFALYIDAENIFGGESREGGIQGEWDLLPGYTDQLPNVHLQEQIGPDIPAYRGCLSVVLKNMYLGLTPYAKPWSFLVQCTEPTDGTNGWEDTYSEINHAEDCAVFIAYDRTEDLIYPAGLIRINGVRGGLHRILDNLENRESVPTDFGMCAFGVDNTQTVVTQAFDFKSTDLQSFRDHVDDTYFGLTTVHGDVAIGFQEAQNFFAASTKKKKKLIIIGGTRVTAKSTFQNVAGGVAIKQALENTYGSDFSCNVAVLTYSGGMAAVERVLLTPLASRNIAAFLPYVPDVPSFQRYLNNCFWEHFDMNPAHIIRYCLTNLDWGLGTPESNIDDVSFLEAAKQLRAEGLGVSLVWSRQGPIEDFINEVKRHINAEVYQDRETGKFKIKLIRKDYDKENLITLDESNIKAVRNYKKTTMGELINSVTINFFDMGTEKTASVTVHDTALQVQQGQVNSTSMDFDGFSLSRNAIIAGQYLLRALSTSSVTCDLVTGRIAKNLHQGDPFTLNFPDFGVYDLVMRVTGIDLGDGVKKEIRVTATQDVYALYDKSSMLGVEADPEAQTITAVPASIAMEVPYLELVQQAGQSTVDGELAIDPYFGYLGAAAARPSGSAISCSLYVDEGLGYEESGVVDFCPSATLTANIDRQATSFDIENIKNIDTLEVGSWFQIGNELMSYESLVGSTLTVKRGVLDTIPEAHTAGDYLLFWDDFAEIHPVRYVLSDDVDVKLPTVLGSGVQDLTTTASQNVVFDSRAIRPYPPANVKIKSSYDPGTIYLINGTLVNITFATRNRTQQTGDVLMDWYDSESIAPEVGTTFEYEISLGATILFSGSVSASPIQVNFPDYIDGLVTFKIKAVRDGFDSLYEYVQTVTFVHAYDGYGYTYGNFYGGDTV